MSFGFSSETPQDFNLELVKMGIVIGNGDEIQQYWKLSMDMLEKELQNVYNSLIQALSQQGNMNISRDEYDKRLEQFKDAVSKLSWSDSDITISPTQFYNKFMANCVNVKSFNVTSWRDMFEHIGASSQCAVAQKKINEVISWDTCYICGTVIQDKHQNMHQVIHDSRECEHLLPAFTSLGYKGLIQSSKAEFPDDYLEYFKYEYANAHRCCNQIKTDDKWIKYDINQKIYLIDEKALATTLTNILTSGQYDCNNIEKNKSSFVNTRGSAIMSIFLNPILHIINTEKKEYGDLFDLKIRINQLSALKLNINQIAHAILTGQAPAPQKINIKMYNITYAKFLAKKQFSHPENLFFDVFNDFFSTSDVNMVEQMFSVFFGQQLRKFVRISRKIFEFGMQQLDPTANKSFSSISNEMLYKSLNDIDVLFQQTGNEEIEESILIPFNNQNIITLKIEFRKILFTIVTTIISTMESSNPQFSSQFNMFKQQIQQSADADQVKDQQIQSANQIETNTLLQQGGGSNKLKKKSHQLYKKMVGGSIEENFENSYKNDVVEIAEELGFNPALYGINVVTTRSGRVSKPPLSHVGLPNGASGIKIGNNVFIIDYASNGVRDYNNNSIFIPFTYKGQQRGILDNVGNFYQIGGRKKKLYKKTRKSKNIYHKKYTIKNNKSKNNKSKNNK